MPTPEPFHPDLRAARFLPRSTVGPRSLGLVRLLTAVTARHRAAGVEVVTVGPGVTVRYFRPAPTPATATVDGRRPALLDIHGGGFVAGLARQDDRFCRQVADRLGVVVASVDYRLAPEHPFPTPLEDCYAALVWLADRADVDRKRIAIGGLSAGAGLAAGLALLARERGQVNPVLLLDGAKPGT